VDDAVGLDDLVDEGADLVLVHGPDLVEPVLVGLLKALELVLQLLELLRELLVVVRQLDVLTLVVLALTIELLLHCPKNVLVTALLGLEGVDGVVVDLFALLEDLVVELELLLVEAVDGLHVFHALLEDLHLLLKLDLLLGLVVRVLRTQVLQLLRVVLLVVRSLVLEVLLQRAVLLEELLDLLLITRQDLRPLVVESLLDVVQLVRVVSTHLRELELHVGDEHVDVIVLLLERRHVLVVLVL